MQRARIKAVMFCLYCMHCNHHALGFIYFFCLILFLKVLSKLRDMIKMEIVYLILMMS